MACWGVHPQWDNRRGNGNRDVSNQNEMTNNYGYVIKRTSSQKNYC
jgi:hypothetical protein